MCLAANFLAANVTKIHEHTEKKRFFSAAGSKMSKMGGKIPPGGSKVKTNPFGHVSTKVPFWSVICCAGRWRRVKVSGKVETSKKMKLGVYI